MPASKPNATRYAVIGGFALTAIAAFVLGRISGGGESSRGAAGGPGATSHGGSQPGSSHGNGNSAEAAGPSQASTFSGAKPGAGQSVTISQITGGQPLGDWVKKIMTHDDPQFRMRNLLTLVEALRTPEEFAAAFKSLGAFRGSDRDPGAVRITEFGVLMAALVKLDPKAAIAHAGTYERGEKNLATMLAMRSWAQTDSPAALQWAAEEQARLNKVPIEEDDGRFRTNDNVALVAVLEQLARTDLDQALKTARSHFEVPQGAIIASGASEGASVQMGGANERAVSMLAGELISQRGPDAAKAALESMDDGLFKDTYTRQLAGRLAQNNPADAATWAAALPAGEAKSGALSSVMNQWARQDAVAAGQFLSQLPMSPETDSARERYADRVSGQDPEGALAWAETITNQNRRNEAIREVIEDWSRRDPQAAAQWQNQRATQFQRDTSNRRNLPR